jgi:thiamine-phosphate pyrophosphorylase
MPRLGGLYVIIDPEACRGRNPVEIARAALDGGASMLQWRDKLRDKGDQLGDLHSIHGLCRGHNALLVVNDHADLALVLAARTGPEGLGVHVGQKDLPVEELACILPPEMVIGASTNNPAEAKAAEAAGASYIAVGDIFGTASKAGTRAASPARLAEVRAIIGLPVFGIGGINAANLQEVIAAGADGVAVISAVCAAEDPRAATEALVQAIAAARAE